MKIALIYEFLSEQGGLEREIINHANFLKENGHEVIILTCHKTENITNLLPFGDLNIEEISLIKTRFMWINLALCFFGHNSLKNKNYDLFLSYSFPSNFLIRNKKNKKINYVNHYPHFLYLKNDEKFEWANTLERKLSLLLFLFFGNYLKKLDKKLLKENVLLFTNSNFTKKRIESIYNTKTFVSYPSIYPEIKISKEKLKEKFIFICGRIVPDKKYEWLIKSCSLMKNKIALYVAGQGEEKYLDSLKKLAKKMDVSLVFLGKLNNSELIKYYSNAELFAFPTPLEDFGLVPAESLTCGTPCVVWGDGAGPTEQVVDGLNGFYAQPYDLEDFAKKMDLCLNKSFKKKNRKIILNSAKKFSSDSIKKDFLLKINKIKE